MAKLKKPILAVSGCLLGEEIRYNGQHKRQPHLSQEFNKLFDYISFCPELEMGLGVPRAAIHLMERDGEIRLVDAKDSSIDHTRRAQKTFKKMRSQIEKASGIVLTKNSPSCGYDPVKVYDEKSGSPKGKEMGMWALYLEKEFPHIPKVDSGRLYNDDLRDTFRTQVIAYYEFKCLEQEPHKLIKYHETYKYYFFQYGAKYLKELGQICAGISKENCKEKYEKYADCLFKVVFKKKITIKNRTNMVEHLAGYFKNDLNASDKKYLHSHIAAFRNNKLKFESLILLIEFLTKTYNQKYLKQQKIFKLYSRI